MAIISACLPDEREKLKSGVFARRSETAFDFRLKMSGWPRVMILRTIEE